MKREDARFASWTIAITSILYGVLSTSLVYKYNLYGQSIDEMYRSFYYIPFILLTIFGILKIIGLSIKLKLLKRVSIIGLMFCWGFLWTGSVINFVTNGPSRGVILIIPVLAICIYVAMWGDYSDD